MIGYLEGRLLDCNTEAILLLAGQVGYEVQVSPFTRARVTAGSPDDTVRLYIYYHVTERQPKPVLIGFLEQRDKAFFSIVFVGVRHRAHEGGQGNDPPGGRNRCRH